MRGIPAILEPSDGCLYPIGARYRAELRRAAALPNDDTLPEDVDILGVINEAIREDCEFLEDGR